MAYPKAHELEFTGYYPGVIGRITELHAVYYHEQWGFDVSFETQVGRELSDFMATFSPDRDGFWVGIADGEFAGSISIDGREATSEGARLRWFIVGPSFHGRGIGTGLIRRAVRFCEIAGHKRIYLWTFEGLDPARKLYEQHGFRLVEEHVVEQWGTTLTEQKFELGVSYPFHVT